MDAIDAVAPGRGFARHDIDVAPLGERALRQFFRDTAARVYRIPLPA